MFKFEYLSILCLYEVHCLLLLNQNELQLIGIGYWRSLEDLDFPDPAWFVNKGVSQVDRDFICKYLTKAEGLCYGCGHSWCRFRCHKAELDSSIVGSAELTDGKYVWPEGLVHYIKEHDVWLPDEFVNHARKNILTTVDPEAFDGFDFRWWRKQKGFSLLKTSYDYFSDIGVLKVVLPNGEKAVRDFVLDYLNRFQLFERKIKLIRDLKTKLEGAISGEFKQFDGFRKSCKKLGILVEFESFDTKKRQAIVEKGCANFYEHG